MKTMLTHWPLMIVESFSKFEVCTVIAVYIISIICPVTTINMESCYYRNTITVRSYREKLANDLDKYSWRIYITLGQESSFLEVQVNDSQSSLKLSMHFLEWIILVPENLHRLNSSFTWVKVSSIVSFTLSVAEDSVRR